MNYFKKALIIALVALAATAAFAGNKQLVSYTVSAPIQVGAKTLAPGEYTISITRTGDEAKVVFLKNGLEIATSSGIYTSTNSCGLDFAVLLDTQSNVTELCGSKFKGGVKLTGGATAAK